MGILIAKFFGQRFFLNGYSVAYSYKRGHKHYNKT